MVNCDQTHSTMRQVFQLNCRGITTVPKNDKFKHYMRYAEHCLNMVASTKDPELRCMQREMAAEWLKTGGRSSAPA